MRKSEVVTSRVTPATKQKIFESPFNSSELLERSVGQSEIMDQKAQMEVFEAKIEIVQKELKSKKGELRFYKKRFKEIKKDVAKLEEEEYLEKIRKTDALMRIDFKLKQQKKRRETAHTPIMARKKFIRLCRLENVDPDWVYSNLKKELRMEVDY